MGLTEGLEHYKKMGDSFTHIPYEKKLELAMSELIDTDPNKIMKRGWKRWDNILGGIYGGKIYAIGAETGTGKTTFVNQVVNNVSQQGHRVVRYSLEDRMEDAGKEELFYEVNKLRKRDGKDGYRWIKFVNNEIQGDEYMSYLSKAFENLSSKNIIELDKKKNVTIDDLCVLMEMEASKGASLFVIDHLHYFEFNDSTRLDLQIKNVMHKINEIGRKYNVPIFLVAHYKNQTKEYYGDRPSGTYFRDASAIKQVANYIIQLQRNPEDDNDPTLFYLSKIRGPIKKTVIKGYFIHSTYEYDFNLPNKDTSVHDDENFI